MEKLYYFDINRRIYEIGGVKKNSPYYIGHFRPIEVIEENDKEVICKYGAINKRSMMYKYGRDRYKVYTERQMIDAVYVHENANIIAEKVRYLDAETLRKIDSIILQAEKNI